MNGRKKTLMMTILMLTMPITGCIGGEDDDDEPGAVDISGCTDPLANNYDSSATTDDGTCTYDSTDNNGNNGGSTTVYTGCMDESATNYNPAATEDDGTCEYDDDETSTDFAGISGFDSSSIECGPTGDISIAGSSTVFPVANLWAEAYQKYCNGIAITLEGGGSGAGAGRVCDNSEKGTAVDIGDMSRGWKTSEASVRSDGYTYDCLKGDTSRSAVQISIAADGLSVVVKKGGAAETCISGLPGGGLSVDQARWIWSDYTAAELTASGWDSSALANSDNDDSTHLWSELDASCPASEIKISGADSESGTYEFFMDAMLNGGDGGETFDLQRPDGYTNSAEDEVVVNYLTSNGDSIGYFGYAYYKANQDTLTAVAIMNDAGEYVAPTPSTVADGSYNPLGRFIYMNLHLDSNDLALTLPFLEFGFSSAGDALVNQVGYVPLTAGQDAEMELQRISWMYHTYVWTDAQKDDYWCGSDQTITVAGSSTVFPVMNGWGDEYSGTDGLCPGYTLTIEGGGSGAGAGRVCDNSEKGTKVMIGDMSRGWKAEEATSYGNGVYHCLKGDTSIQVTQLPVGLDGLSVVVKKGGAADTCVSGMGGLTVDQVRWIYSDYTAAELVATGWDSNSLANSDGDDSTHLWSELDASCPASEIKIAGADSESGTYEFFGDAMFADKDAGGETFDLNRPDGYTNSAQDEVVVNYLESNGDAIGYFGYAYYVAEQDKLSALPIQNSAGNFVAPNAETIADGSYNPLTRAIYINVNHEYMDEVYNYLRYAFSALGDEVVNSVGYVPLSGSSSAWQDTWMRVEAVINNS
jgi:phosphate transport system substrate-binding protein